MRFTIGRKARVPGPDAADFERWRKDYEAALRRIEEMPNVEALEDYISTFEDELERLNEYSFLFGSRADFPGRIPVQAPAGR